MNTLTMPATPIKDLETKLARLDQHKRAWVGLSPADRAKLLRACLATLDKEIQNNPPAFMQPLPNLGHCAIVKAFVEYDRI